VPEPTIRLAVLFGGRSGEHEISCASAAAVLANLDRRRYEVVVVRIGWDGVWTCASAVPDLPSAEAALRWQQIGFPPADNLTPVGSILAAMRELARCDVVFPVLHGPYGEDGTLQALLGGLGIPFVGNGVLPSALGMDKEYTKKIASSVGVAVVDGVVLRPGRCEVTAADRERLGLPVFVKPAREGSSIGVSRVDDWAELPDAVDLARKSDEKVLVEAAVLGREIDIGVLERPGGDLEVSPPLEILTSDEHTFFDYRAKYGDAGAVLDVPATLDPVFTEALAQDALRLFRALDCTGLLRVDFFVCADGRRVFNEVNTFPGFSSASQYPRMWKAAGLGYGDLLDVLVDTALARQMYPSRRA
jgi:D-alanine-D-alanine ligase